MAAAGPEIILPGGLDGSSRQILGGTMPVIAAVLAIICVLLIWAVFFRKPSGRRERGQLIGSKPKSPGSRSSSSSESESKSGRRRRRREKKRPRNPTLAETGGLPPLGAGDSGSPPL